MKGKDLYQFVFENAPKGCNAVLVQYSNCTVSKLDIKDIDVLKHFHDRAKLSYGRCEYKKNGVLNWDTFKIIKEV